MKRRPPHTVSSVPLKPTSSRLAYPRILLPPTYPCARSTCRHCHHTLTLVLCLFLFLHLPLRAAA